MLRTPMKQRRRNEDGVGQIMREEEEGEVEFFVVATSASNAVTQGFFTQGPLPPPPGMHEVTRAGQPSSSRAVSAVIRHQLVLLCFMITPQGSKFMARRTDKGHLAIPTVAVSTSPTTKEAIKAVAATFIADRFPFRLIPGIRIGRKTVAAAIGGHFSVGMLDVKMSLETAALLATQGVVWLPSTCLASSTSDELQDTYLTEDVNAKWVAEFCNSLATDKQPYSAGFRSLLLAPWGAPPEVDAARRPRQPRQPAEEEQRIQLTTAQVPSHELSGPLQQTPEEAVQSCCTRTSRRRFWSRNGIFGAAGHGIQIGMEKWTLMTIYAPADPVERRSFLQELPAIVPDDDNMVFAGDFNVTLVPGLDSPEVAPRKTDAAMLSSFITMRGLSDAFQTTHPMEPNFTWFSSQRTGDRPAPKRRLDLMLVKGAPWEALTTISCSIESLSDHRPLTASFQLAANLARGPGTFLLNTDLLNLPGVTDWIAAHWRDWQQTRHTFDSKGDWLQMGFRIVTRALDAFSRMQARHRRQQEECRNMVAEAEAELEERPLAELYWQHRRDRWLQKLEDLQVEQQILWAKKAQEKRMITGDRLSKETCQRLCPPRAHALIREFQHPFFVEAPTAKDSTAMGEYARDILTSRRHPGRNLQQLRVEHDMWRHTQAKLTVEARLLLDRPITLEELWEAIKSMAHGKSPGSDGLPVEFYEAIWDHVGPDLLSLYNHVLEGGALTADMKLGLSP
ncbi:hypothetical protein CBR_g826 [Chara braunii]|uniref:Endonuclease/exonuclease/phosphatase domain-containing protein n=1 Tax=Chara braunii TaxID=69332 RepID=A0A388KCB2_CHABU|nr:hypothetical protein CBR_g826 [Chara braunii]|eukprot:GBG67698.1 hypothetical protein CBR_g826 [Chara braunii]